MAGSGPSRASQPYLFGKSLPAQLLYLVHTCIVGALLLSFAR